MQYVRGIFPPQFALEFFVGDANGCCGKWEFNAGSQNVKVIIFLGYNICERGI